MYSPAYERPMLGPAATYLSGELSAEEFNRGISSWAAICCFNNKLCLEAVVQNFPGSCYELSILSKQDKTCMLSYTFKTRGISDIQLNKISVCSCVWVLTFCLCFLNIHLYLGKVIFIWKKLIAESQGQPVLWFKPSNQLAPTQPISHSPRSWGTGWEG